MSSRVATGPRPVVASPTLADRDQDDVVPALASALRLVKRPPVRSRRPVLEGKARRRSASWGKRARRVGSARPARADAERN